MDKALKPTILVVEDEAIILMDAIGFLEDAGYACLEAVDAEEATRLLRSHPEIIALFTDIEINGSRNGLDLAQEAHRLRPSLRVLIASGRVCPVQDEMPPQSRFISKPYRAQAVTNALHDLLAA
jgi:DNA-binding NtrC family response regulator